MVGRRESCILDDIASVGECMVEMAPTGDGLYRQSFADDALNTAWYVRALVSAKRGVRYVSAVGADTLSDRRSSDFRRSRQEPDAPLP